MSARRPRTSGRRPAKGKDGFVDRDEYVYDKSRQKKRKLSDLLGPPWSEEDLKLFYQSYRRYGRDWKKVASQFQNRTIEMVEVLYKMNQAYLSLPEGAATAAGLIAMMTDHYNILEEESRSADDDESSKEVGGSGPSSRNIHSRPRSAPCPTQTGSRTKVFVPQACGLSSYGGPSPAKKPRTVAVNRPRIVGKRTPRVPFLHLQDKKVPGKLSGGKPTDDVEQDSFGDCDEMKVALTLAASASQRAASPQVSRTPASHADRSRSSPIQNGRAKHTITGAATNSSDSKNTGSNMDDAASDDSRDTDNGVVTKANRTILDGKNNFPEETKGKLRKVQKPQPRKGKIQSLESFRSDELKEECSCTEEGTLKQDDAKGKKRLLSQKSKKRSRQLFSGDERSGLDALATLADLSLNGLLPSPRLDAGSAAKPNKDAWIAREDMTSRAETSFGVSKDLSHVASKEGFTVKSKESFARLESDSNFDADLQRAVSVAEMKKRKRRGVSDKREQFSDGNAGDNDDMLDAKFSNAHAEELPIRGKVKRVSTGHGATKYSAKPVKQELDQECDTQELNVGESEVEQAPMSNMKRIPVKRSNMRKSKPSVNSARAAPHCPHASSWEDIFSNKVRLTHCLSSEKVRRWCIYEWFYSAIDLPWFARNEFVEYLNHAGLGHVPRLTRAEWGVIRGSLGKPRRLSKRFLQEERDKLESYRDSVRKHYQEVRMGHLDGLPNDLPRPLTVGQRVIARHPKTKEIYNGSILTVDWNKCRVQFDLPEMGVELVPDVDCMPVTNMENLSETLVRKGITVDGGNRSIEESKQCVKSWIPAAPGVSPGTTDRPERPSFPASKSSAALLNAVCKQAQAADTIDSVIQAKATANEAVAAAQQAMFNQPGSLAQVQAREADIRALADLTRALDKKEAILLELRNMNDDADVNQKDEEAVRKLDMFQKHYATLLLQLKEVNQQVCAALMHLRQRNKYQENCPPPWQRSVTNHTAGITHSGNSEPGGLSLDQFPIAKEVTMHAKQYAKIMVNTAVETMLSMKEGEDALSIIGLALNQLPKTSLPCAMADSGRVDSASGLPAGQVSSGASVCMDWANTDAKPNSKDAVYLPELISSCVATLLMVQAFTERQFPPAEIAMAFDSILASLRPTSSQNYPIYTEIQHYAGLLKNQIIALIPTQSLPVDCSLPH